METLINPPSRKRKTAAAANSDITAAKVLRAAVETAREKAFILSDAACLVAALGSVNLDRGAYEWLAAKFAEDCEDIATDLDHAQNAIGGGIYPDSESRFRALTIFPDIAEVPE